jgi:hypothetical protein
MSRFLLEVPHSSDVVDCTRAVAILLRTGSHFLMRADWGCHDGVHKAWVIVEAETHDEARNIVPAEYRKTALVVKLNHFELDAMERFLRERGATT